MAAVPSRFRLNPQNWPEVRQGLTDLERILQGDFQQRQGGRYNLGTITNPWNHAYTNGATVNGPLGGSLAAPEGNETSLAGF